MQTNESESSLMMSFQSFTNEISNSNPEIINTTDAVLCDESFNQSSEYCNNNIEVTINNSAVSTNILTDKTNSININISVNQQNEQNDKNKKDEKNRENNLECCSQKVCDFNHNDTLNHNSYPDLQYLESQQITFNLKGKLLPLPPLPKLIYEKSIESADLSRTQRENRSHSPSPNINRNLTSKLVEDLKRATNAQTSTNSVNKNTFSPSSSSLSFSFNAENKPLSKMNMNDCSTTRMKNKLNLVNKNSQTNGHLTNEKENHKHKQKIHSHKRSHSLYANNTNTISSTTTSNEINHHSSEMTSLDTIDLVNKGKIKLQTRNGYLPISKKFLPVLPKRTYDPIKLKELYLIRLKEERRMAFSSEANKQETKRECQVPSSQQEEENCEEKISNENKEEKSKTLSKCFEKKKISLDCCEASEIIKSSESQESNKDQQTLLESHEIKIAELKRRFNENHKSSELLHDRITKKKHQRRISNFSYKSMKEKFISEKYCYLKTTLQID